jgi:hypothetical protein
MESQPFSRWSDASGSCPTAVFLRLHCRAIAAGLRGEHYRDWAGLLQQHRPATSRLIRTLRTWAQQGVA